MEKKQYQKQGKKINSANNAEFAKKLQEVSKEVMKKNMALYKELSYR